ncbi:MAG: four helix bundle protein [Nitrospiraceae bacterium]
MGKDGFKELVVWQKAKDLAVIVYRVSDTGSLSYDFSLRDQIRKSAVSVATNLAEGDERNRDNDSIRFFQIAKGSLAELRTQLQIACMDKSAYESLDQECTRLGKMMGSLIQARYRAPRQLPLAPRPSKLARKTT